MKIQIALLDNEGRRDGEAVKGRLSKGTNETSKFVPELRRIYHGLGGAPVAEGRAGQTSKQLRWRPHWPTWSLGTKSASAHRDFTSSGFLVYLPFASSDKNHVHQSVVTVQTCRACPFSYLRLPRYSLVLLTPTRSATAIMTQKLKNIDLINYCDA